MMTQKEYEAKLRKAKLRGERARADKLEAEANAVKDNKQNTSNMASEMKELAMTGVMVSVLKGMF